MLIFMSSAKTFSNKAQNKKIDYDKLVFSNEINELVQILKQYSKEELAKLMKMSNKLADENYYRYKNFFETKDSGYESIFAFDGAVFKAMDSQTFTKDDLEFAEKHLRVLSGLYGIIKPLDVIKEYRLEMATKLENSNGKNLYDFWKSRLTGRVLYELNESKTKTIINLASEEYTKAINLKEIEVKGNIIINIDFKEKRGDKYKVIGTYAKRARGLMVRYIIKNKINNVNDLKNFNLESYKYNEELSNENNLIFTRDQ